MFEDVREPPPVINEKSGQPLYYRVFRLLRGGNTQNIKPIKLSC